MTHKSGKTISKKEVIKIHILVIVFAKYDISHNCKKGLEKLLNDIRILDCSQMSDEAVIMFYNGGITLAFTANLVIY